MAETHVNISGTWKSLDNIYSRHSGDWKKHKNVWRRTSGVWKLVHLELIEITNNSVQDRYNLFSAVGSPDYPVRVVFTNNAHIHSTDRDTAGLRIMSFHSDSVIKIINNSTIFGMWGNGGSGNNNGHGNDGEHGGDAIAIGVDVQIDNSSGNIFGGGGGGGGGGTDQHCSCCNGESGDGGDGQGRNHAATSGGVGDEQQCQECVTDRTDCQRYGDGGDGGDYGANGGNGDDGDDSGDGGQGGNGGKAVDLNGNSVTWLGGFNSTQVKGDVS